MSGTPRMEALRERYLSREKVGSTSDEMVYLLARGWMENDREPVTAVRYTKARAAVYEDITPVIGPEELIVGRPNHDVRLDAEQRAFVQIANRLIPRRHGQDSHMALDYEKLLALGTTGLRDEILSRRAGLDPLMRPEDIAKETFYDNCLTMLAALDTLAARYAGHARALAAQAEAPRRQELLTIAENLMQVPAGPARTFYQALQSIHLYTYGLQGLYQMGRPDQYLLPFYERDIAEGRLTEAAAQELIDCFCLLYNEYTAKGLAVGLMVGGRAPDGTPVCNALTRMFVQSVGDVRLAYPGVGLCMTEETPDDLLRLACEMLSRGHSHPALFGDEVITRGLMRYGLPREEASQYIHSTCVEITPVKRSAVWVASPYHNLIAPLLTLLGMGDTPASDAPGIEALIAQYQAMLRAEIQKHVYDQNRLQMERTAWYSHPLVSCLVDDCLARGLDVDHGGARYAFIEPSFVGMANLVDALFAIDQLVYRQGRLTLAAFGDILRENYGGQEPLRQYILTQVPKYGNDIPEIDALFARMSGWVADEVARYRTWHGSHFVPSMFCWIMHAELGKETPASPDGRLAGFPLGDGSGPAQGREYNGPTASILSSTSWPHERFIGGLAINMKFARHLFDEHTIDKMMTLVRMFFARGGFELQINVTDREKLLAAQKQPELYRDLVVRIGGYSDYFTNLTPAMQQEVLLRTEHGL